MRRRRALGKEDTAIELTGKVYGFPAMVRFAESGIDNDRLVSFEGRTGHEQHFGIGKPVRLRTVEALLESAIGMRLRMLADKLLADDIRPQRIDQQRFGKAAGKCAFSGRRQAAHHPEGRPGELLCISVGQCQVCCGPLPRCQRRIFTDRVLFQADAIDLASNHGAIAFVKWDQGIRLPITRSTDIHPQQCIAQHGSPPNIQIHG